MISFSAFKFINNPVFKTLISLIWMALKMVLQIELTALTLGFQETGKGINIDRMNGEYPWVVN